MLATFAQQDFRCCGPLTEMGVVTAVILAVLPLYAGCMCVEGRKLLFLAAKSLGQEEPYPEWMQTTKSQTSRLMIDWIDFEDLG